MEKRLPVLDESGKVQEWIRAGRGVTVWRNQEIGVDRPNIFTPADVTAKPHWAYDRHLVNVDPASLLFYKPVSIRSENTWSDTPAGWKAAGRALNKMPDVSRVAPIGHVRETYTLKRIQLESKEQRADGRPLCISFRVGILEWLIIDKDCQCEECKVWQAEHTTETPGVYRV